jgi:hypothetical protein
MAPGRIAQLDAGRDLVDVLAARAAGMNEGFLDLREVAAERDKVRPEVSRGKRGHAGLFSPFCSI